MEKITNENMEKIAIYMDDDIREWTHGCYAPCSNEEFIKSISSACYMSRRKRPEKRLRGF